MPLFFFETIDAGVSVADATGQVLSDRAEARKAAIMALPEMALDALPDGNAHEFAVIARDEAGAIVYKATLTFQGVWGEADETR